jgi:hypothetical protein
LVTLKDGSVLHLRAHSNSKEGEHIVFYVLMKGTPHFLVDLVWIPESIVAKVRGG